MKTFLLAIIAFMVCSFTIPTKVDAAEKTRHRHRAHHTANQARYQIPSQPFKKHFTRQDRDVYNRQRGVQVEIRTETVAVGILPTCEECGDYRGVRWAGIGVKHIWGGWGPPVFHSKYLCMKHWRE